MSKSFKDITQHISHALGDFKKMSPDVMQSFHQLGKAATKSGVLDEKTKELIALSIGVANRCDGCIGFHTQALVKLGITKEELSEALNVAVYMGGGPSLMYAAEAMAAYQEFAES